MAFLVPSLSGGLKEFLSELLSQPTVAVSGFKGWPGRSAKWRDLSGEDFTLITDWFAFLGVPWS